MSRKVQKNLFLFRRESGRRTLMFKCVTTFFTALWTHALLPLKNTCNSVFLVHFFFHSFSIVSRRIFFKISYLQNFSTQCHHYWDYCNLTKRRQLGPDGQSLPAGLETCREVAIYSPLPHTHFKIQFHICSFLQDNIIPKELHSVILRVRVQILNC